MHLSKIGFALGAASLLIVSAFASEAKAQRGVLEEEPEKGEHEQSSNLTSKDPLGVSFELTNQGLVENFTYSLEDGDNTITFIENASGHIALSEYSSMTNVLSYSLSLPDVKVDASSNPDIDDFFTDIILKISFGSVSEISPGLSSEPTPQSILNFLFEGDSQMGEDGRSFLNANLIDVRDQRIADSDIIFPAEDVEKFKALFDRDFVELDSNGNGLDPLNADIRFKVLEFAAVPEPGIALQLIALGAVGAGAILKKKQLSL